VRASEAARRAVESERDRLRTLLAELSDAVVFADRDEVVQLANRSAVRLLGQELIGRRLVEVVRDHELFDAIEGARAGRETVSHVERDGGRRVLRASAKPLGGGEILLAIQDLSSLRRLETQRRDFVANVSHELRTPLAALSAMVETLRGGALDDRAAAADFLDRIQHELDGLTVLVSELLTLTRMESGHERLELRAVAAATLVRDEAGRLAPLAERAGVTLRLEVESAAQVRVDPARMGQVIANLVHNAIKFTPPGGLVSVGVQDAPGEVTIAVRDSGLGIAAGDLERIFERFFKADASRSTVGSGLGLAIAKHAVQAHGGTIHATSDGPGRGATFRVTLPRAG
jgi:two-component system phosphate regulon sensor histidine kinase PhoR